MRLEEFGEIRFIHRVLYRMLFCPSCANLLVISTETGYNKWACNTCAYEFPITKQANQFTVSQKIR